jgi:hypothetical protein
MRKLFLLLIFCLGLQVVPTAAQVVGGIVYTPNFSVTSRNLSDVILDNGVYELPVSYQSHTGQKSNYVLDVKIQNDNVVCIYFGNGGYVHSGYNNSGYSWRGGGIKWNVDWSGNIISGHAIIQVTYDNGGYQLFTVRIE